MKPCDLCGRSKPDEDFLAGKAKKPSRACAACRKAKQRQHVKNYYRSLPVDKRNTLTMARRAANYGVRSEAYSRLAIMSRWRWRCVYCDAPAEHLDHVHPLSRGGEDVESNILPACASCNLSKGAMTLAQWVESWR